MKRLFVWCKWVTAIGGTLLVVATIFGAIGSFFWKLAVAGIETRLDNGATADSVMIHELKEVKIAVEWVPGIAQRLEVHEQRIQFLYDLLKKDKPEPRRDP